MTLNIFFSVPFCILLNPIASQTQNFTGSNRIKMRSKLSIRLKFKIKIKQADTLHTNFIKPKLYLISQNSKIVEIRKMTKPKAVTVKCDLNIYSLKYFPFIKKTIL